jgi:transcription initiation factor TFIID subunit TAF12
MLLKIRRNTELRDGYSRDNQRKLINSILEKDLKKIVIDRLRVIEEEGEEALLVTPAEVKKQAVNTFKESFRRMNHKFEHISDE